VEEGEAERLAAHVRELDEQAATDDEIAAWLQEVTPDFGASGHVLSLARGLSKMDAYSLLSHTEPWKRRRTRYQIRYADGSSGGEFSNANGRTFAVGDHVNLPNRPEPPHDAEGGRGTVWRVVAVEEVDDPAFTARLVVNP
jgi:hypothetical protein